MLWKKVKKGLSAGRVQSVALRLIIDREKEINDFKPEEYWTITGSFLKGKETFEAGFFGKSGKKLPLKSEEDVKAILAQLKGNKYTVDKVTKKERKRNPALPFTTSTLQRGGRQEAEFQSEENDDDRSAII
nr:DNA topoisomerase [Bacillus velezensis]